MKAPIERIMERRTLDLQEYKLRGVKDEDVSEVVRESTLIYNAATGDLEIVYLQLEDDTRDITEALNRIEFLRGHRTGGMKNSQARVFGHQPRTMPRRDFCTSASLAKEDAKAHDLIASYANKVSRYYQQYNPDKYATHLETSGKVLDEWKLEKTPFTSGIINRNNPLPYHFDSGNFSNVWSNMLVFKHQIKGGHLAVPEYDVAFQLPNNSLLMFDGQSLLHGVTPFKRLAEDAWRYSIVYYSLKMMWNCLTITDEIIRAQERRTEREFRREQRALAGTTWKDEWGKQFVRKRNKSQAPNDTGA